MWISVKFLALTRHQGDLIKGERQLLTVALFPD